MHSSQEVNQDEEDRKDPQDSSTILERTISRAQKIKTELMYSIQTAVETIDSLKIKTEEIKSHYPTSSAGPLSPGTAVSRERAAMMEIPETSEFQAELEELLRLVVHHQGSDLHLKMGAPPVIRIEGELVSVGDHKLTALDTRRLILKTMTREMISSLYNRKELDYSYETSSGRFRVNAFLQKFTVSASFRMVKADVPNFRTLHLPPVLEKFARFHNGLFLVTGPAGMGKSTTLASLVNHMNKTRKLHIITIEDPVEYLFHDELSIITQREVGIDTESFEVAVKMALRQDPNVIMIGELRDPDTVTQALMAAETGHLVLSTLHTPNAVQAIQRLVDFYPTTLQKQFLTSLSATLRGVCAQRLIKRRDKDERIPAVEVLLVTPTIASLIKEGSLGDIYDLMSDGKIEGMHTFTQSLSMLLHDGLISKDDALYYAEKPSELKLSMAQNEPEKAAAAPDQKPANWWHEHM